MNSSTWLILDRCHCGRHHTSWEAVNEAMVPFCCHLNGKALWQNAVGMAVGLWGCGAINKLRHRDRLGMFFASGFKTLKVLLQSIPKCCGGLQICSYHVARFSTTFGIPLWLVFLGYLEIFWTNQCPPIVHKLFEANNYGLYIHLEWEK